MSMAILDPLSGMSDRKSKLTLTVDAATVEKAKRLGINISELTEKVLRGFVFDPKDESKPALMIHYKALFGAIEPRLMQYEIQARLAASHADTSTCTWEESTYI